MHRDGNSNLPCWIGALLAAAVIGADQLLPRGAGAELKAVGVVVLVGAAVLMFVPFVQLPRMGGTPRGRPYFETAHIADRGLYGVVRHPQYLGYILLVLGFAALSQHLVTVSLAVLAVGFFLVQAMAEEKLLARRFGAAWNEYSARVPRLNILAGVIRWLRGS